jgi:hypothetical protein
MRRRTLALFAALTILQDLFLNISHLILELDMDPFFCNWCARLYLWMVVSWILASLSVFNSSKLLAIMAYRIAYTEYKQLPSTTMNL